MQFRCMWLYYVQRMYVWEPTKEGRIRSELHYFPWLWCCITYFLYNPWNW